jgi:hypothetical protein
MTKTSVKTTATTATLFGYPASPMQEKAPRYINNPVYMGPISGCIEISSSVWLNAETLIFWNSLQARRYARC